MKRFIIVLFTLFLTCSLIFSGQQEQEREKLKTENQTGQTAGEQQPAGTDDAEKKEEKKTKPEKKATEPIDLGTIVLGATPYGKSLKDLPFNVDIVTNEQIKRSPGFRVNDALNSVPGVIVWDYGMPYSASSGIRMRHGFSRETMILINGIRFMNNVDNSAYISMIPLQAIQRIEVLKGNGSLIYGPDGTAGAVNLITKDARKGTHFGMGFSYAAGGLDGVWQTFLTGSHGSDTFYFNGTASYTDQRGYAIPDTDNISRTETDIANSDAAITAVLLNFGFKNKSKTFYTDFMAYSGYLESGSPGSDSSPSTTERLNKKDYTFTNTTGYKFSRAFEIKVNFFVNNSVQDAYEKDSAPGSSDLYKFTRYGGELIGIIKPFEKFIATVGFSQDWRRRKWEDRDTPANSIPAFTTSHTGIFAQIDYSFSIVQIIAGVRYDYQSDPDEEFIDFGSMVSPTLGVLVSIIEQKLQFTAQLTRTYRMPELTEVRGYAAATWDKDLKPEKHWVFEGGLRSAIGNVFSGKAIFFYQYAVDALGADPTFKLVNLGNITTYGFEISLVVQPLSVKKSIIGIKIPVSFSYAKSDDPEETGKRIARNTNYKYMIDFGITLTTKFGLTLDINGKYVNNYTYPDEGMFEPASKDFVDSYFLANVYLSYEFKIEKSIVKAFVKLLNVLNTKYAVNGAFGGSYTMPGFSVITGLETRF